MKITGLQFGHGGEAVETVRAWASDSAMTKLQFGHGGEAVETLPQAWIWATA